MVGIYADKGITGTSVKKRDDFNRLMRHCKQGKVDMIITKSVARFARNTLDCLKHTRMLKEHNVDVYFEEQGIHSIQPGAEFYITIYGSIAQSESENISANVRWGKAQSAKEGNVPFHYKRFLGYRRGPDGKPEIDPEQAVVVKRICERFLAGDSLATIANNLNADGIPTPSGIGQWQRGTIESILTNEKYKGDAILNKTYIRDCLSKKVMINNGERPKYYVENNHPAIIDSGTFGRVQEEMARRGGKRKVKQVGTKTEQGRYSSKYALTELLICGECGTPYRRCTWAANGKKKVVWRCIKSHSTVSKYKQLITQMSNWAVREEICTTNFARFVRLPENIKKEKDIFTEEDIQKLEEDGSDAAKVVLMLLSTGMRIGELFNLPVANYREKYVIGGEKTDAGRNRVIPIRPEGRKYFAEMAARAEGELLISGYSGQKVIGNFRKRDYYPLLERLGIPKKTPHATRHTYTTRAVKEGLAPEMLQKILGHADYSTTANIYTHIDAETLVDAVTNSLLTNAESGKKEKP